MRVNVQPSGEQLGHLSQFRVLIILLVTFSWILVAPSPAEAASGYDTYCLSAGCKYGKTRTDWETSGTTRNIEDMRWYGGTASGTCDPSNDITRFRSLGDGVFRSSSGFTYYVSSASSYYTFCDVGLIDYEIPNVSKTWDIEARYEYFFDSSQTGSDFYSCSETTLSLYPLYAYESQSFDSATSCSF